MIIYKVLVLILCREIETLLDDLQLGLKWAYYKQDKKAFAPKRTQKL